MLVSTTFIVPFVSAASEEINNVPQFWEMWVHPLLHIAAAVIGLVGALVMLWGFVQAVWSFIGTELRGGHARERAALRTSLGYYILFGLELLIVADVIETITAPDFKHVLVLGLIVVIRTVIGFGLNWEMVHEATHWQTLSHD